MKLLPGHPLLSAHLSTYQAKSPPNSLESAHLIQHLKSGPEDEASKDLIIIKEVAVALAQADTKGRSIDDFLTSLCSLAVSRYRYGCLWVPVTSWETWNCIKFHANLSRELFVAALYMQVTPVVADVWQKTPWYWHDAYSNFFGNAFEQAMAHDGTHHLIESLLMSRQFTQDTRRALLRFAAERGNLDMVRLVWNHDTEVCPWVFVRFPREGSEGHRNNRLLSKMHTPSRQVFDFLMELRHKHCVGKSFGPWQWTEFLVRCAIEGWTDMASHYIKLGAEVDGFSMIDISNDPEAQHKLSWEWCPQPLIVAVGKGRRDMVKLLLNHGASVNGLTLQTAITCGQIEIVEMLLQHGFDFKTIPSALPLAAQRGYKLVVRMLLEKCPDAERVAGGLLVQAVQLEDEELFGLLVNVGGGIVAEHVREQCLRVCQEDGLESMEKLLRELQYALVE